MVDQEKERLVALIEGPLAEQGYEIADLNVSRYKTSVLVRVFLYGRPMPNLEKCARMSSLLGELIEGTDLFARGYTLEVSSPGLDRPLKSARDFTYRIGETVRVEFSDPKRKKITAEIVGIADDQVEFADGEGTIAIPLAEIERAKIVL